MKNSTAGVGVEIKKHDLKDSKQVHTNKIFVICADSDTNSIWYYIAGVPRIY